jgi:hypothetical protein
VAGRASEKKPLGFHLTRGLGHPFWRRDNIQIAPVVKTGGEEIMGITQNSRSLSREPGSIRRALQAWRPCFPDGRDRTSHPALVAGWPAPRGRDHHVEEVDGMIALKKLFEGDNYEGMLVLREHSGAGMRSAFEQVPIRTSRCAATRKMRLTLK